MDDPRPLTADESTAWQAVRLRLVTAAPWVAPAIYRAVPVSAPGLGGAQADRWGRIYTDFTLEHSADIKALADAVSAALLGWLSRATAPAPWHVPATDERFDTVSPTETLTVSRMTAHGAGRQLGKDWQRWARRVAGPPTVSWQRALAGALRQAIASKAGAVDYTYSKPSRRRIPSVITPAMRGPKLSVAVVADISGSIQPDLPTVTAEISRIAKAVGLSGDDITTYAVDDEVASLTTGTRGLDLGPRDGHLTDMRVGIEAALRGRPRPGVVIVLTDGITPWPSARPAVPVIVAIIGTDTMRTQGTSQAPTWAKVVEIATGDRHDEP